MNEEFQHRKIKNKIYLILNFSALYFLLEKIKERNFQILSFVHYPISIYIYTLIIAGAFDSVVVQI